MYLIDAERDERLTREWLDGAKQAGLKRELQAYDKEAVRQLIEEGD